MFTFRQPFFMFPESVGNVAVYIDKSGSTALTIVLNVTGRKLFCMYVRTYAVKMLVLTVTVNPFAVT